VEFYPQLWNNIAYKQKNHKFINKIREDVHAMRKMVMYEKNIHTDKGKKLTLIYSVTIDELSETSLCVGVESYGAAIDVKENDEELCIRHITLCSSEIFALTSLLFSNSVTPATLPDVVYDWLCR